METILLYHTYAIIKMRGATRPGTGKTVKINSEPKQTSPTKFGCSLQDCDFFNVCTTSTYNFNEHQIFR